MKYVLLFGDTKERAKQWDSTPEAQKVAAYGPINQWFGKAIQMAKDWPTGGLVEVRPVVDRGEPQR